MLRPQRRSAQRHSPPTDRVVAVVAHLAQQPEPTTLGAIAEHTGVTRGTLLPMLRSLVDAGWVVYLPSDRTYVIGQAPIAFDSMVSATESWYSRAKRACDGVAATARRRVALSTVVADELVGVYLSRTPGPAPADSSSFYLFGRTGHQWVFGAPYGATLAAWLPVSERRAWMRRGADLAGGSTAELERRLDGIRERGFNVHRYTSVALQMQHLFTTGTLSADAGLRRAADDVLAREGLEPLSPEELESSDPIAVGWIAAPVLGPDGRPMLAMSVDVAGEMLGRSDRLALGSVVSAAAGGVTDYLAGR